ncbi:MAG: 2-phosphosulfolactate phosphatase, partial [Pseudomonadota bacterium]|nr:2-phosphosulfolactate phosphatase [Pseudomonadota bacterium]
MQIRRQFLNRLDPAPEPHDVVVVIDVLRSFSTAAYAFAAGASLIHPVETISEALLLQEILPEAITTGAIAGGDPAPGFDFGNSPSALAAANLQGRELIQTTVAGVRGLLRFAHARAVFAGS